MIALHDTKDIVAWLTDGARSALRVEQAFAELCDRLVRAGIPLWTAQVFVRTPHPDIRGRRLRWRLGSGVVIDEIPFGHSDVLETTGEIENVQGTAVTIRHRLSNSDRVADTLLLRRLLAEGVSEVAISPLRFTDGPVHVATWATRNPGGFTDAHIAAIESIVAQATRVAEIRALTRTTDTLLKTYIGRRTGTRLLAGQIRRQYREIVHAAILISDMRGFTALANRLPPPTVATLLNRYFDAQVPAIVDRGGDLLNFIGDGLLAVFPVDPSQRSPRVVCGAALAAAREINSNIANLGELPQSERIGALRFGLALHLGEILYVNIGGGDRLDFTCIGPAINLASRLEKLAGRLGRSIVASENFAAHCRNSFAPLGRFALSRTSLMGSAQLSDSKLIGRGGEVIY